MTFGNYIYQDNTSQSRQAAVNQLIDTADNLEAGHLKAVETASQLKTTIANLDMNEAEDGFKQQLQADLEQTIENNIQYGNMYYALDDIIKKSGDILSNPAVIGRLKTQQDYKTFQNDIDKRNDIPQYMKQWYKSTNPYNYTPTYDDEGNENGYEKWKPSNYAVSHIDGMALAEKAIKIAHSDISENTRLVYIDDYNNQTNKESATGIGFYNTITDKTEILSYKKLYDAFRGLYDTDPIVKASINAEIAYAKWAREHGDLTDYGAFDATGNFIGLEQYIKNKFDKIGHAAKYLNQTLTTKNVPSRGSGGSKTSSKVPGANAQGGTKDAGASTSTNNVPKTGNSRAISSTKATTPNPEDVDDINNEQGL